MSLDRGVNRMPGNEYLPLRHMVAQHYATHFDASGHLGRSNRPVVLGVDDNDDLCIIYRRELMRMFGDDVEVHVVKPDELEAVARKCNGRVCALLADWDLVETTGGEAVERLREKGLIHPMAAAAFVTSHAGEGASMEGGFMESLRRLHDAGVISLAGRMSGLPDTEITDEILVPKDRSFSNFKQNAQDALVAAMSARVAHMIRHQDRG